MSADQTPAGRASATPTPSPDVWTRLVEILRRDATADAILREFPALGSPPETPAEVAECPACGGYAECCCTPEDRAKATPETPATAMGERFTLYEANFLRGIPLAAGCHPDAQIALDALADKVSRCSRATLPPPPSHPRRRSK